MYFDSIKYKSQEFLLVPFKLKDKHHTHLVNKISTDKNAMQSLLYRYANNSSLWSRTGRNIRAQKIDFYFFICVLDETNEK